MKTLAKFSLLVAATLIANPAQAEMFTDANLTSNVIFGSGNANGGFNGERKNGVEIGLRAKLRFDENNQPQNTFNNNGDGTYTFQSGTPSPGFGWDPNSTSTASWNFEWSVNSNYNGTSGFMLDDLTYIMSIDFDPTSGTSLALQNQFDPINVLYADHAIGINGTGNGQGAEATDEADYASLISNNNLAQNSWNMQFFDTMAYPFDDRVNGEYTISLKAFNGATLLSESCITVNVVPEPSTYAGLLGIASISLLAYGWRRKQQQAV